MIHPNHTRNIKYFYLSPSTSKNTFSSAFVAFEWYLPGAMAMPRAMEVPSLPKEFSSGDFLLLRPTPKKEEWTTLFNKLLLRAVPVSVLACAAYNFVVAFVM